MCRCSTTSRYSVLEPWTPTVAVPQESGILRNGGIRFEDALFLDGWLKVSIRSGYRKLYWHINILWYTLIPNRNWRIVNNAKGGSHGKPVSKDFQLTYGIGPSSSIKASLDSLVKKGILYKTTEGKYQFSDTFMPCWIDYIGDKKQGW